MRIYPASGEQFKDNTQFEIKKNKTFKFIWRGRQLGDSEIRLGYDKEVRKITFGNHGTSFQGTFYIPWIGDVTIEGRKLKHGHGKKRMRRQLEWSDFSEAQHEFEARAGWGW